MDVTSVGSYVYLFNPNIRSSVKLFLSANNTQQFIEAQQTVCYDLLAMMQLYIPINCHLKFNTKLYEHIAY